MRKVLIITICILAILGVLSPVGIYYAYFKTIPKKTEDWGTFGDFIGGTINPIIGLLSLIILGYLTWIISKEANKQSRNHQFLSKRMDAYEKLVSFIPRFNVFNRKINIYTNYIAILSEEHSNITMKDLADIIFKLQIEFNVHTDFYYCIYNFKVCYGHLFEYDFDKPEFQKLLVSTQEMKTFYNQMENSIVEHTQKKVENPTNFLEDLTNFINDLRDEMNLSKH